MFAERIRTDFSVWRNEQIHFKLIILEAQSQSLKITWLSSCLMF